MTTRYATIVIDNEGEEIVSAMAQMEGGAPEVNSEAKVEKVADGVLIGMVRGGPIDAVAGWGFPAGSSGSTGRSPTSAKPEPVKEAAKPVAKGRAAPKDVDA